MFWRREWWPTSVSLSGEIPWTRGACWATVHGIKRVRHNLKWLTLLLSLIDVIAFRWDNCEVTRQCPELNKWGGGQSAMCSHSESGDLSKPGNVKVLSLMALSILICQMRVCARGTSQGLLAGRCWFVYLWSSIANANLLAFSCEEVQYPPLQNLLSYCSPSLSFCAVTDPIIIIILYLHN